MAERRRVKSCCPDPLSAYAMTSKVAVLSACAFHGHSVCSVFSRNFVYSVSICECAATD